MGFVPYSPLGHGLLTGQIRTVADFANDDWRKTNPRFTGENFTHRRRGQVHRRRGRRHPDTDSPGLAPHPRRRHRSHPGHRRVARAEENTAADAIELTPDQIHRLDTLTPAVGARHDDTNMATIDT